MTIYCPIAEALGLTPQEIDYVNGWEGRIVHTQIHCNFNFGLKRSKEAKKNMSLAQLNSKNHSTRNKKRPEFAEKMKGDKNPFYAKNHTPATKFKMSIAAKNRSDEVKKKYSDAAKNRSTTYIEKLSKTQKVKRHFTNGINNLFIDPKNGVPEGYRPGRTINRKFSI